jgi:UDP-glucose 4-epimerase
LQYLTNGGSSDSFNLGIGNGFSVREVIETARRITGKDIKATPWASRDGDPPVLIGSAEKAKKTLHWKPRYHDLSTLIQSAWTWHKK